MLPSVRRSHRYVLLLQCVRLLVTGRSCDVTRDIIARDGYAPDLLGMVAKAGVFADFGAASCTWPGLLGSPDEPTCTAARDAPPVFGSACRYNVSPVVAGPCNHHPRGNGRP